MSGPNDIKPIDGDIHSLTAISCAGFTACCEASMYRRMVGRWSAVFQRCAECRDLPADED